MCICRSASGVISQWDLRSQQLVKSFTFNDNASVANFENRCDSILSIHVYIRMGAVLLIAYRYHRFHALCVCKYS